MKAMNQWRLFRILLTPSLSSSVSSLLLANGILLIGGWPYFAHKGFLEHYYFGPEGLVSALQQTPSGWLDRLRELLSGSFSSNLTILWLAIAAGVSVFVVLEVTRRLLAGATGEILDAQHQRAHDGATPWSFVIRTAIRLGTVIVWACYTLLTVNVIVPFCLLYFVTGIDTSNGVLPIVLSYVVLATGLHMHIVFARLLILRPRLFGSDAVFLAEK